MKMCGGREPGERREEGFNCDMQAVEDGERMREVRWWARGRRRKGSGGGSKDAKAVSRSGER